MAVVIKPVSEKENSAPTSLPCGVTAHVQLKPEILWTFLPALFRTPQQSFSFQCCLWSRFKLSMEHVPYLLFGIKMSLKLVTADRVVQADTLQNDRSFGW